MLSDDMAILGYPSNLVNDQFSKASAISRNDLLRTRGKEAKKLFPFVITFNPNLPIVGNIIRKHLFILQSNPKLKELFPRGNRDWLLGLVFASLKLCLPVYMYLTFFMFYSTAY